MCKNQMDIVKLDTKKTIIESDWTTRSKFVRINHPWQKNMENYNQHNWKKRGEGAKNLYNQDSSKKKKNQISLQ